MNEKKEFICKKCKHYFNLHISYINDWHNDCNNGYCYLCTGNSGRCGGFEEGDVPVGEIRGEDECDREKRLRGDDNDEL